MKKLKELESNLLLVLVVLTCLCLTCGHVFSSDWNELVFREDFDFPSGGMPDSNKWVCNHPENSRWIMARTFFPSQVFHPEGPFPKVDNGVCTIQHHHFAPRHRGVFFHGGEIHTVRMFAPNSTYRFEARVKCDQFPNGLVSSFFLYGCHCNNSDEIDFEFLSNYANDDVNYPNGDPVLANTWNESFQWPQYVETDGLDLTEWNTFRIYWYADEGRLEWTWIDPCNIERLLRIETNDFFVPDEPMHLYFNFWAPNQDWPEAYDANLQPVSDLNANEIYNFEIDYVEVRKSFAGCGDANHPYPTGDLNYDCCVDSFDLSTFSAHWLEACPAPECYGVGDLNKDNTVSWVDFSIFASHWLECSEAP